MRAAEGGTSVSAMVKGFLTALAEDESDAERMRREERALRAQIKVFRAADRLPRDQTRERNGSTSSSPSGDTSGSASGGTSSSTSGGT